MAGKANYIFTVSMDIDADKEAIFNEVYDTEHIPLILKVPGVVSAKRYKMVPLSMVLGGEKKTIVMEGEPAYMAIYELETADVLTGQRSILVYLAKPVLRAFSGALTQR